MNIVLNNIESWIKSGTNNSGMYISHILVNDKYGQDKVSKIIDDNDGLI